MKKLLTSATMLSLILSSCGAPDYVPLLTHEQLEESLNLGTQFLLANQKPAGNFNYSYNFETDELSEDDNQVRQAGALWGLTLIYAHEPSQELESAIVKGLDFYGSDPFPKYPGDEDGSTGTLALLCLSLMEFLSVEDAPNNEAYLAQLKEWLQSLASLENSQHSFYSGYSYDTGAGKGTNSPYFDGEALLALSKAANFFEDESYFDQANESLAALWEDHVTEELNKDSDPNETKGFYQWSTMSLYQLDKFQRENLGKTDKEYLKKAIDLANWMIEDHDILNKTRNTAYAYEGLISAYHLAMLYDDEKDAQKILPVIDEGLLSLTSWQVGHSLQNSYIEQNAAGKVLALGGITNAKDEGDLRIDVTQHQMHAVLLALEWIYN